MRIYLIKNTINGKIYIGQTVSTIKKRFNDHKKQLLKGVHGNHHLQSAWNKYGKDCWEVEELIECTSVEQMNEMEIYYISTYNSTDRTIGYNIRPGGDGGGSHSDETKEKLRKITTDQWIRDRELLVDVRKRQWTEQHRQKMKLIMKKKWMDPSYVNMQTKSRSSDVVRNKLKTAARKNSSRTAEIVKNRWSDEEYKKKVSESIKKSNTDDVKTRRKESIKNTTNTPKFKEKFKKKMAEVLTNPAVRDNISKSLSEYFGKVQSPDGTIYEVIGLRRFCREHNLGYSGLRNLKFNPNKTYKGWKLLHEDNNSTEGYSSC